jgi:CBS domain-containing protein
MAKVYQYMTPSPATVPPTASVREALDKMRTLGIRHLPVVDAGVLLGVVSDRDVRAVELLPGGPDALKVEQAMAREPYFVQVDASVRDVAAHMAVEKLGSAVVMDRGNVVGIFTTVDALRALVELGR